MEKKDWLKIGMYIGLAFLVVIIVLTIFHFTNNKDNIVFDLTQTEEKEEPELLNLTEYSEAYLRDLVSGKKEDLQKALDNMVMYKLNDDEAETSEIVVSELFIEDLRPLLSDELMSEVMDNLEAVDPNEIIDGNNIQVYRINNDWLNEIKTSSSVASEDVSEYKLSLIEATNDLIESKITVTKCQKVCDIKESYPFIIILDENTNTWKIDKIR